MKNCPNCNQRIPHSFSFGFLDFSSKICGAETAEKTAARAAEAATKAAEAAEKTAAKAAEAAATAAEAA